jgi:hypothetical protein
MSSKNIASVTYKDCSDLSLRTEAKEEGISPGKLKLIKAMQQLNPDITVDEYKEAKVSEIITEADDLISKVPPVNEEEKLKGTVKNIKDTAQKMRDSKKETGKEKNSGKDPGDEQSNEESGAEKERESEKEQKGAKK